MPLLRRKGSYYFMKKLSSSRLAIQGNRILALLMALSLLAFMLAGCASENTGPSETAEASPESEAPSTQQSPSSEPEQEPDTSESEPMPETEPDPEPITESEPEMQVFTGDKIIPPKMDVQLPLSEEPVSFTFFFTYPPFLAERIDDLLYGYAMQELESHTNVSINFDSVSAPVASERFNIMAAAGDLSDIIQDVTNYYTSGMDRAVEDELILDLKELIQEHMAVYSSVINASDEIRLALTSSDGHIGAIARLYSEPSVPKNGSIVRQDWLEELGLETPDTVEEYYNVLSAFKTEKNAAEPFYLMNTGVTFNNAVIGAYDVIGGFFQIGGEVKYGFAESGFKDYLIEMNKWYSEGLISPDYINNTSGYPESGKIGAGDIGIFVQEDSFLSQIYGYTTDPDLKLQAIPDASIDESGTNHFGTFGDWIGGVSWSISTNNPNPELCLQFIDYLFTEDGSLLANYGVEGISLEFDADGNPYVNEMITNNPDYSNPEAQLKYTLLFAPFVEDYTRFYIGYTEDEINAPYVWMSNSDTEYKIPSNISISTEYIDEYNDLYLDIETFVQENINKFITGTRYLSEFDAFVSEIEDMGIGRCIEIWQIMLDAYMSK